MLGTAYSAEFGKSLPSHLQPIPYSASRVIGSRTLGHAISYHQKTESLLFQTSVHTQFCQMDAKEDVNVAIFNFRLLGGL